jgi:hypothetical protein
MASASAMTISSSLTISLSVAFAQSSTMAVVTQGSQTATVVMSSTSAMTIAALVQHSLATMFAQSSTMAVTQTLTGKVVAVAFVQSSTMAVAGQLSTIGVTTFASNSSVTISGLGVLTALLLMASTSEMVVDLAQVIPPSAVDLNPITLLYQERTGVIQAEPATSVKYQEADTATLYREPASSIIYHEQPYVYKER